MDDSIDLGKNFRYIQDYPQGIIYQISDDHIGSGPEAIPAVVVDYAYDDSWIIAINKDMEDQQKRYWIVDKNENYQKIAPLDSLTFYENIDSWNIELRLKKTNANNT
ncbi:MAG: hypothetical protein WBA23_10475 [Tunicatimonas sp.]|uniref:hypothetical protein n=1 Tax=Tunicatimonas sp. TaxID=1940096 RepID=UPI003C7302C0